MKKHIPNLVTLLNLFSGCVAAIFVIQGQLAWGAVFVFLGIFFDFMDGLLARALDARSELGLQLDSLADVVTSGVVPGLVLYKLLALALNVLMK
jgi:CDP-diacylglycerol--serine O-phosphatidyltransferase